MTPNGISVSPHGKIWGSDTSSSLFFSFDPETEEFTTFVTPLPHDSVFGNYSGIIKDPISRPYWSKFDDNGRLLFNEQTSNSIAVFDPLNESLVEYLIPSKNPNWADCQEQQIGSLVGARQVSDCGLAQVLDFTTYGNKIWFTEWVENKIGVIDTSITLPFEIQIEPKQVSLNKGESIILNLIINSQPSVFGNGVIKGSSTSLFDDIIIFSPVQQIEFSEITQSIPIEISVADIALIGKYKVVIAVYYNDLTISEYITVEITQ